MNTELEELDRTPGSPTAEPALKGGSLKETTQDASEGSFSEEITSLRGAAMELLARATRESSASEAGAALERAASALKSAAAMGMVKSKTSRVEEEIAKLRHANNTFRQRERSQRIRDYVELLTPTIAIVTLGATLATQSWQFHKSEQLKGDEAWRDAVKAISTSGALAPGVVSLEPFLQSGNYKAQAKDVSVSLISSSTDTAFFYSLFASAFTINWGDVNRILAINRAVYSRATPIYQKAWDAAKMEDDPSKLTDDERKIYDYANVVLPFITRDIGALFKTSTGTALKTDMSSTYIIDGDWRGVDLKWVNISGAVFLRVDLQNADLSGITDFEGAAFMNTAWWDAKSISPALLSYLLATYPYSAGVEYGPYERKRRYTEDEYRSAIRRLSKPQ